MKRAFVNSLPKSGTNLLAKCLTLLGYRERGHLSAGVLLDNHLSSRLRRLWWMSHGAGYLLGIHTPIEVRRSAIARRVGGLREGEFLTAHVGYTGDLIDLSVESSCVPIVVIRDPRAVLASSVPYFLSQPAHFLSKVFSGMTEEERYRAALLGYYDRKVSLQPLRASLLALDPWLRSQHVHTVRFEDLVGEGGGGSRDRQIKALGELCRVLGATPASLEETAESIFGPGRHTFRKGQIDSWKSEIPGPLMPQVEEELGQILVQWGYVNS